LGSFGKLRNNFERMVILVEILNPNLGSFGKSRNSFGRMVILEEW
jgi:hypothetical protein